MWRWRVFLSLFDCCVAKLRTAKIGKKAWSYFFNVGRTTNFLIAVRLITWSPHCCDKFNWPTGIWKSSIDLLRCTPCDIRSVNSVATFVDSMPISSDCIFSFSTCPRKKCGHGPNDNAPAFIKSFEIFYEEYQAAVRFSFSNRTTAKLQWKNGSNSIEVHSPLVVFVNWKNACFSLCKIEMLIFQFICACEQTTEYNRIKKIVYLSVSASCAEMWVSCPFLL